MSRLPCEARRISYAPEGLPTYSMSAHCAHPDCTRLAADSHHIVRRSYTQGKGPQTWIAIDGNPVPNLIGLCREHHRQIEEGEAQIEWVDADTILPAYFAWVPRGYEFVKQRLHPVPLVQGVSGSSPPFAGDAFSEREDDREENSTTETHAFAGNTSRSKNLVSETASEDERKPALEYGGHVPEMGSAINDPAKRASSICPTCKRKLPKPKEELEKPRVRVKWALHVPKDSQENGAEILDTLVEQAREQIGREEGTPPYYTLVEVLYAFTTSSVGAA